MNAKKTKEKERRRARKLADQAWEAADKQNLDLAEKLIRRAVETQPENPVLWNDQGMLLCQRNKEDLAEEAFRAAISLAPTYADPYAHLAAIRTRQGYLEDAIRLMEKAVEHAPQVVSNAERLAGYRALVKSHIVLSDRTENSPSTLDVPEPLSHEAHFIQKLAAQDWQDLGDRLTRDGCVMIPALVNADVCTDLRGMFDDDALFAKTVVMDRDDFGRGAYRYFRAPIPKVVDALRHAAYVHVAKIANEWQRLLNDSERYPSEWEGFRDQCRAGGQTTPTPILLKYGPGGFNALHRDLRGSVFFPIQMAVVLSPKTYSTDPETDGFRGGEFLFCDVPETKKSRQHVVAAGLGDTVLFCTRDRLVRVGGAYGLQPVKHGVQQITEGSRLVLGVPFHEYR